MDAGWSYSAALTDKGNVYTFGWGDSGRLGHGDHVNQALPHLVTGIAKWRCSGVKQISCGDGHCLAVTEYGDVLSWGNGVNGVLGHGTGDSSTSVLWGVPRVVETLQGVEVAQVAGGAHHSAAITTEGQLFTWGEGAQGQLGRELPSGHRFDGVPRVVEIEGEVAQVACGFAHTLILTAEGAVYGCGNNLSNQIALTGENGTHPLPVLLPCFKDVKVLQVAAGREHSMALTEKNEVVSFGCGLSGQLGVGPDNSDAACHGGPCLVDKVSGNNVLPQQVICAGDFSAVVAGK